MFVEPFFHCCVISRRERINLGSFGDETFFELNLVVPYSFDWHAIGGSFVKDEEVLVEVFWDLVVEGGVDGLEEVLEATVADEA